MTANRPHAGDHLTTSYGAGTAREGVARLGQYVAIADPAAWDAGADLLPEPVRWVPATSLEVAELNRLTESLPDDIPLVGLGGGLAMDAAKYCAVTKAEPVTLLPSLTSTNAPFTDAIAVRRDGEPVGMYAAGAAKHVIVDVDLLLRGPARLNRAGFADLVAVGTALHDWKSAPAQGGPPYDPELGTAVTHILCQAQTCAAQIRAGSAEGLEALMRLYEALTRLLMQHPTAPLGAGSEHLFAWTVETVTNEHFVHGELVALGMVVTEFGTDHQGPTIDLLDKAGVPWRPADLGLEWAVLTRALQRLKAYNDEKRRFNARLAGVDWTNQRLSMLRRALEEAEPYEAI